jgi:PhzF family phenazine biosynthesis protein
MKINTYTIDAFTDKTFGGNPAAVCLVEEHLSNELMQLIAAEINLSETAFITKTENKKCNIRYFTPTVEIDFCGHATLASAKVVIDLIGENEVEFTTAKDLKIKCLKDNNQFLMNFPLYDSVKIEDNQKLNYALTLKNVVNTFSIPSLNMIMIEIESKEELCLLKPDFSEMLSTLNNTNGVIVTSKSDDFDFYSRFFCPWIGINEDPVTGAAHTALAKYWSKKLNKTEMNAYQASKRGGVLNLTIISDSILEVRGNAVVVFEGIMNI